MINQPEGRACGRRRDGEPSFDVDAFSREHPHSLHTIPADNRSVKDYLMEERYDESRVWTREVRTWSRRQSRAIRRLNKVAEVSGTKTGAGRSRRHLPTRHSSGRLPRTL